MEPEHGIAGITLVWLVREIVPMLIKKYRVGNGSERREQVVSLKKMEKELNYIYSREKDKEAVEEYKLRHKEMK